MSVKILLTSAGGGLAPQLIRFLKNSKVHRNTKIYGVDMNLKSSSKYFADHFQIISSSKKLRFVQQINKICRKFKINLVIPGSDEDALSLSKN